MNHATEAEWEDFRKDGSRVWIRWRSRPLLNKGGQFVGVVSVGTDMTFRRAEERRRAELEGQLFHAQRMETIGVLSSGIAHDFNNILAAILMRSDIALDDQSLAPKARSTIEEIRRAGLRARGLVRRMMHFSRRDEAGSLPVDVRALLLEVATFIRPTLPPAIKLEVDVPPACATILADDNRLFQVFVNLATNAAAAMPAGGRLEIVLTEELLAEHRTVATGTLAAGRYLATRVSDTGSGMGPETISRIFEPFFTTKRPDQGTGLGLTIVASIVEHYNGGVQVESTPGAGTAMTVLLPALVPDSI
jgi:signal transduction histidine kinase